MATTNEYIFMFCLEFVGLIVFSFLMSSVSAVFGANDSFEDLVEYKVEQLDIWVKKIEKSNKPYHMSPSLYNEVLRYIETAIHYDFNLIVEEFPFFKQFPQKLQTEVIQSTAMFKEFERSFSHFFEECERGFINEVIVNLRVRTERPGKTLIQNLQNVTELCFIRQGLVEVFNNPNDEFVKD